MIRNSYLSNPCVTLNHTCRLNNKQLPDHTHRMQLSHQKVYRDFVKLLLHEVRNFSVVLCYRKIMKYRHTLPSRFRNFFRHFEIILQRAVAAGIEY